MNPRSREISAGSFLVAAVTALTLIATGRSTEARAAVVPDLGRILVLEDASRALTPEMVARLADDVWKSVKGPSIHPGSGSSVIWIRMGVVEGRSNIEDPHLVIKNGVLDDATVFAVLPRGEVKILGRDGILANREILDLGRDVALPLFELGIKPSFFLLRISGQGPLQAPLSIMSEAEFHRHVVDSGSVFGALLAVVIFFALLVTIIAVMTRRRDFFLFGLHGFAMAGMFATTEGAVVIRVGEINPVNFVYMTGALTYIFLLLFFRETLKARLTLPKMDNLLSAVAVLAAIVPVAAVLSPTSMVPNSIAFVVEICTTLIFTIVCWRVWRNSIQARLLFCGFSCFALGSIFYCFYMFGILPQTSFLRHAIHIGGVMEMLSSRPLSFTKFYT